MSHVLFLIRVSVEKEAFSDRSPLTYSRLCAVLYKSVFFMFYCQGARVSYKILKWS